ncbi:NAD-dependent epimerase/dehydratase family protein [Mycolicibacterium sp. P1-18]|uniref:NAD-dependent epimerase/dehydratase family protein n=1 Tax=Mycolicibacterium sp. P1-18 TaxID=2024615 RepID=UPI0011F2B747|nr:NAD-dependent epimerase/dehydratase family protein [Mycolicibacterium sp. P1-18]KAA0092763.1 NAD-dependent epimerase/dehydratase family protein [Mycolicibacterium sp. P1-18]
MRIFATGATGFIGLGVARAALDAGHQVTGLVRSTTSSSARDLAELGVALELGDLNDPQTFVASAAEHDAVVHTASTNDASAGAVDQAAVVAVLAAMPSGSALVYTSGAWVYGNTGRRPVTESAAVDPTDLVAWRPAVEQQVLSTAAQRGIGVSVLRPAMVHGHGGGVFALLARMGRDGGVIRLPGDGRNHWPTVHVDDLGTAYVSALEQAAARNPKVDGRILNVVAEEAVEVVTMAEAIRTAIGADTVAPWPVDEARQQLGLFADALALNQSVDGREARRVLEWSPQRPDAITDLTAWPHQ